MNREMTKRGKATEIKEEEGNSQPVRIVFSFIIRHTVTELREQENVLGAMYLVTDSSKRQTI